jgi:predicted nucleic acid-binding protein
VIVVDTNLVVNLVLGGSHQEAAEAASRQDSEWAAPLLWRSELRNVLASQIARKAMTLKDAEHAVAHAEVLMAGREHAVASVDVLRLAASSGCTAYDCECVALAAGLGIRLVTSDRQVLKAFPAIALSPEAFVQA